MAIIEIKLQATDDASGVVNGLSGALSGLANIAGGALAFALGGVLTDALHAAEGALGDFFSSALAAEKQQSQLAAVLKSTGEQSGLTQDAVNALAQQFKDLAGGSDEAIVAIEEIGIRSGAINAEQMPQFIRNVTDLGAVMGDTSAAATLLARAQEDPIAALGRLQRAGILFSESLKEQIKDMAKHGDTAGATALIMQRVAEATGGAAAANADTLAGRWDILRNHLEDAGKSIVEKLLPHLETLFDTYIKPNIPVIEDLANKLADQVGPAFTDVQNAIEPLITSAIALWPQVQDAISGVVNFIIDNMPTVQADLKLAWGWITEHQDEIKGALIGIGAALVGAGLVAAVVGIGAAIAALVNPVGLVIAAAAILGAAWAGNWGGIRDVLTNFWTGTALPILTQLWNWLQINVPLALQTLSNFWTGTLLPAINSVWTWITGTLFPALSTLWIWLGTTLTAALQTLSNFWTGTLQPAITTVYDWLQGTLFPFLSSLVDLIGTLLVAAIQGWINIWNNILSPALHTLYAFLNDNVFPLIQSVGSYLTVTLAPGFKIVGDAISALVSGAMTTLQNIVSGISQGIQTLTGYINGLIALIHAIPGIPGVPGGGGGGGSSTTNNNSPTTNTSYNLSISTTQAVDVPFQFGRASALAGAMS